MNSLRARLLAWLLGAVLVVGITGGLVLYRNALAEANEFFDEHLRETALLLRDQAYGFAAQPGLPQEVPQYDFVVQVWSLDGRRVYLSQPAVVLPRATTLGFDTVEVAGSRWRIFGVIARGHVIQVGQALRSREERAARLAFRTLAPFGVMMPALALLIWWAVGRSLEPLRELAASIKGRRPGALDPLPAAPLPHEVQPLVASLNELLERLRRTLEHERAFIADAAHELRSPLTALSLQLQALAAARSDADQGEARARLEAGVARATRLVEQVLPLAREERADVRAAEDVRLDEVVREILAEFVALADRKRIDLGLTRSDAVPVRGDPDALRALVRNLVDNAIRYTPADGRVDVSVSRIEGPERSRAVFAVTDTGPGIPPDARTRVFDRFFRVPGTAAAGSGIGLAIVKSIAERHRAAIELGSGDDGRGLRVSVAFDASPGA